MAGVTWRDKLRYRFDRVLARGSAAAIWWVVGLALLLALVGGLTFWVFGVDFDGEAGFVESFWQSLLIAIGRGSVVTTSVAARITSFIFVTAAVFLTGGLIGALVAAVNSRLDELRRGRSRVLERGHTVLVGWSPRLHAVVDELLAERPSGTDVVAVVLADRDKTQMEDEFRARHDGRSRSRVVFRSGNPTARADLEMVAVDEARSVIVLSEGGFVDAMAVRRSLAAFAVEPDEAHVVAELSNPRVARSLRASTDDGVVSVTVGEVVADMMAQAIRVDGMAQVFAELLSFRGHELYVEGSGEAAGMPFADAVLSVTGGVVVGVVRPGHEVMLLPPPDLVVDVADKLILLAESKPTVIRPGTAPAPASARLDLLTNPLSVVMIGWNPTGPGVVGRLSSFLPAGSRVQVMADTSLLGDGAADWVWEIDGSFQHTKHEPEHVYATIEEASADVVAVLGYSERLSEEESDALTLLTLLTLEQGRRDERLSGARVVAHLFDSDLAQLATVSGPLDFVVTDALASRMLVHTSRHPELAAVFADLFDAAGPVVDAVRVVSESRQYGAVAAGVVDDGVIPIGYATQDRVHLNPALDAAVELGPEDRVLVIRRHGGP